MAEPRAARFVLARPANALNIGAVARAMANFGFDDLFLVSPSAWSWRDARSAVYEARVAHREPVQELAEALTGCAVVLGTASAHNRAPRLPVVTLPALEKWLAKRLQPGERLAVVFGSERSGLSNEELSHCHALLRVPTSAEAPSMNLGQAAAVVAYALAEQGLERSVCEPALKALTEGQLAGLIEDSLAAMAKVKVNAHMSPASRRRKLREGYLRWNLSDTDAAWLRGLLVRLARLNEPGSS